LVLGLGGAFGATQVLAKGGILMGVSPNDPLVFVAIAMVLVVVGVFACWLPARRAAALEPNEALRQD
jgi:ABC-type antimicrobial peptide transport system permease subunit